MFVVSRNGEEVNLSITGNIEPFVPGQTSGPAEFCYPSEGGFAEITVIHTAQGIPWDGELTLDEEKEASDILYDDWEARRGDIDYDDSYDGGWDDGDR